ncbi:MAG: efflux RND transporter periplasmic adaptor subunit [Candidatus Pseudobacter hemicellulosilyticus]|uniref:Efflux RND transporter periplasmic adaptor subunit n=1 Tax=Candidatus Pseudobacter hemicellulosilyticus TaxID=3121375 RepID=A0AAJ6BDI0_9BACT|nr:MAG: efflux RND transporter periplasmic adaptor subunit [Pseudobacter sp.]
MKKYKKVLIGVLVIAALGISGWYWKFREEKTTVVLKTEKPEMGTISLAVTATGTIQPVDTVAVGSQVSGTINRVLVDFNSVVKKGQLLAQLDQSLLQAQVQQMSANLEQAKSNLTYQQSNFQRQEQLYKVGAISKAEQETALYQYNTARDNVSSVSAQLVSAQRNLSFTDIYSPIDGTVLTRSVSEGQTVAASFNTPTLFSIARDLTQMQVQASVDEADIGNVAQGQRVTFTVDAFPDDVFNGTVKEIRLQPTTSSNVVSYTTIIDAPNADKKLKPGMTASISIYTKEVENALLLSNSAFNFSPDSLLAKTYTLQEGPRPPGAGRPEGPPPAKRNAVDSAKADAGKTAFVWVKQDSSLVMRRVTTGMTNETQKEILSGLQEEDLVVTGYEQVNKKDKAAATTGSSPFMPKRPGGNNRQKNSGPPPP